MLRSLVLKSMKQSTRKSDEVIMKFNEEQPVNFIKIKACFENSDVVGPFTKETVITLRKDELFIKCPMRECVEGGFDLRAQYNRSELDVECSGASVCQGWQDKERINKHRCLCKLQWEMIE